MSTAMEEIIRNLVVVPPINFPGDLSDLCRICRKIVSHHGTRSVFSERSLRLIENVLHMQVIDGPGLPRHLCERCCHILVDFQRFQLGFRRSEENYRQMSEYRKNRPLESLIEFADSITNERVQMQEERELRNERRSRMRLLHKTKQSHSH